ncbi:MAG: hypothetical protein HQ523_15175 [Lentisphaerae bacterium]|nr:hypothetical protein [Lentisphaerota bacterium]
MKASQHRLLLAAGVMLAGLLLPAGSHAGTHENLIQDPSFESALPLLFEENGRGMYYATKEKVPDAPDGDLVMVVQGWASAGSIVPSHPLGVASGVVYATSRVRLLGATTNTSVELALFNATGVTKLDSFATVPIFSNTQWTVLQGTVTLANAQTNCLGFIVNGAQTDASRVEIDQVGLFCLDAMEDTNNVVAVTNTATVLSFEAEEMADGVVWKTGGRVGWVTPWLPSSNAMLWGDHGIPVSSNSAVTHDLEVPVAGTYRLWVRFGTVNVAVNGGTFTFAISSNGTELASKEVHDADFDKYAPLTFKWESIDVALTPGTVAVSLSRPAGGTAWVARKVDFFILTNLLAYEPEIRDFLPPTYMRYTNLSHDIVPYGLFIEILHAYYNADGAPYRDYPGMLTAAGNSLGYYVPADQARWLTVGHSSPWIRINDYPRAGDINLVSMVATRYMHTGPYVTERLRGNLEFAVGHERDVVRTIPIDQEAPRILLTFPGIISDAPEEILTSEDYIGEKEARLAEVLSSLDTKPRVRRRTSAQHLRIEMDPCLSRDMDGHITERETVLARGLGANCIRVYPTEYQLELAERHGLPSGVDKHFTTPFAVGVSNEGADHHHPDTNAMAAAVLDFVTDNQAVLDDIALLKAYDEPGGMSYAQIANCVQCCTTFRSGLQAIGMTLQDLNAGTWDEVVPVGPADRDTHPQLFYHTGVFRLQGLEHVFGVITGLKNEHFGTGKGLTTANFAPPYSEFQAWTQRGTDPFLIHRNGGLESLWTEDWLGYGAGPEQMSDIYALLRSAGRSQQSLGAYVVVGDTSIRDVPGLLRRKIYTAMAGGVTRLHLYNGQPCYINNNANFDISFDIYPELITATAELSAIDDALNGTTRKPTDIALLYNRTSAIWEDSQCASEQNNRMLHWALTHAGYDAAFVDEVDIESGALTNCKVLYMSGAQITSAAAVEIADWVENGGVLFGSAGAGTRNEYNQPTSILSDVFGAQSSDFTIQHAAGRPKYEMRTQPVLNTLTTGGAGGGAAKPPDVTFNQLCASETLSASGNATTFLIDQQTNTVGTIHYYGAGVAIRVAGMPGLSYLNEAVKGQGYDINSYTPRNFPADLRDFIAWPAELADARRVASTEEPICEIVRYDGEGKSVVFVVDHDAVSKESVMIEIHDASQFNKVWTASCNPVRFFKKPNGVLVVRLPMFVADAIVLEE